MIQIFNPSRLTRQPFFIDLVDYLDHHDDVILREIKAQFPDVAVDKLMEECIKAGLILRENKRYCLNLPFLESIGNLSLDQEIFVRELVVLDYVVQNKEGKYELAVDFDKERLTFYLP